MISLKIGFVGAGKVGFSLGKYFTEHGVCVSGYYSLYLDDAKEAAIFTNTKYYKKLEELVRESDTLFLTVPDGNIHEIYTEIIQFNIEGKCLAHCSGALSSCIFADIDRKGARGCSIHPICAVSDRLTGYQNLSDAFFTVEGENTADLVKLLRCCGNKVESISAAKKVKYHAALVFASNLVAGLYDISTGLLQECGLSETFSSHALQSLFTGNVENIATSGVIHALTGPVERADAKTIEKHLMVLNDEEREIYRLLSDRLIHIAEQKNPDRDYHKLRMLLENSD